MPWLELHAPDGEVRRVTLTRDLVVGRGRDCDMRLKYDGISRRHARIKARGQLWQVEDAGSRNGTMCNGRRLHQAHLLADGDRVEVGSVTLVYMASDQLVSVSDEPEAMSVAASVEPVRTTFTTGRALEEAADVVRLRQEYDKLRLAHVLTSELVGDDVGAVAQRLLDFCIEVLPAETGVVVSREDDADWTPRASVSSGPMAVPRSILALVEGRRAGLLLSDAVAELDSRSVLDQGARSVLVVPIIVDRRIRGIVYLQNTARTQAFSDADLSLLAGLCAITGSTLERQRMQAELERAARTRVELGRFLPPHLIDAVQAGQLRLDRRGEITNVTVLDSDVRGFTSLSERLGPSASMELLNAYFEEMVDVAYAHGGIVDKFMGDGLLVLWGALSPQADDSERAVNCAIAMMERLDRFNARRAAAGHVPVRIGIGLHRGPALVGLLGARQRLEFTAIGDTVNTAARLCSLASADEIVASSVLLADAGPGFRTSQARAVTLKGKEQPLSVASVLR